MIEFLSNIWRSTGQLFRRESGGTSGHPDPLIELARELQALPAVERDLVARGLAFLWQDFVERSSKPETFDEGAVQAYVGRLRAIGDERHIPARRLQALAAAAMAIYLEQLHAPEASGAARQFSAAIVELIDRGRALQPQATAEVVVSNVPQTSLGDLSD